MKHHVPSPCPSPLLGESSTARGEGTTIIPPPLVGRGKGEGERGSFR